jgi:hypothetical protein
VLDQLVVKGTVRYHEDLASACLDAHPEDAACFYNPGQCDYQVIEGLLPAGAPCASSYECPANSICVGPDRNRNSCELQTCVTLPAKAGDNCSAWNFCFSPAGLTCIQGVCVANGDVGASCGDVTLPRCGRGLYCELATMTCAARGQSNPCADDFACVQTHFCSAGTCAPRLPIGAPCAGAPTGCVAFAACDASMGVCVPAGHVGQLCYSVNVCASGVCESDANGLRTCMQRKPLGATCTTADECVSGGCSQGVCTAC